jgi:hypothetical protein
MLGIAVLDDAYNSSYLSLILYNDAASSRRLQWENQIGCLDLGIFEALLNSFNQYLPSRSETIKNLRRMVSFMSDLNRETL